MSMSTWLRCRKGFGLQRHGNCCSLTDIRNAIQEELHGPGETLLWLFCSFWFYCCNSFSKQMSKITHIAVHQFCFCSLVKLVYCLLCCGNFSSECTNFDPFFDQEISRLSRNLLIAKNSSISVNNPRCTWFDVILWSFHRYCWSAQIWCMCWTV